MAARKKTAVKSASAASMSKAQVKKSADADKAVVASTKNVAKASAAVKAASKKAAAAKKKKKSPESAKAVAAAKAAVVTAKKQLAAAKAALAAGKQGKFWEYHDALFANQGKLSDAFYEETAKSLGLNVDKWKTDMADASLKTLIDEDKAAAAKNDIQGTPGFFVNGVAVKGAYPLEHFKTIIDRHLKG